jgi:hypothetical protein
LIHAEPARKIKLYIPRNCDRYSDRRGRFMGNGEEYHEDINMMYAERCQGDRKSIHVFMLHRSAMQSMLPVASMG